ncbi:synaptic vesicle protein, putative [Pediculus humanus corporis]|uniref:Synaptic vesicle protein, putative n=1 Tax=Pediculus humanus subsp. corporis TaxID=121224 RepID=E0VD10_PEDHC|nr:synaptic vesicle protein, putative [Pediculus humanus corporis]EEB11266.1 synaptic vesicle protein, putative [Pediculus humanus corporis]
MNKGNNFFKKSKSYTVSVIEFSPENKKENKLSIIDKNDDRGGIDNNGYVHNDDDDDNVKYDYDKIYDFEEAISATQFGSYNWFLLIIILLGHVSTVYSTTTMSYVLPSAECDLHLTNVDKGMLNSMELIGMTLSGFIWGILSDSAGRKNILIIIFGSDTIITIMTAMAQNLNLLIACKFLSGIINGSGVAIMATLAAECHSLYYRASVTIGLGFFYSFAIITLPILAWLIIPTSIHLSLFNGYINLPNWRIFILASSIPGILSFIGFFFTYESPKFLMFQNKNDEALEVFKKIYNKNTGKSFETFPASIIIYNFKLRHYLVVKILKNERPEGFDKPKNDKFSFNEMVINIWNQIIQIFRPPYFLAILLPCVIQFCTAVGVNTIRLWSPQLFASVLEYEKLLGNISNPSTICDILTTTSIINTQNVVADCDEIIMDENIYVNSMIIGAVTCLGYVISGYAVRIIERKWLLVFVYFAGVVTSLILYWSTTSKLMVGVVAIFIAILSTGATAVISVIIDIFPTFLRSTAVSLCMTLGRTGGIFGNSIFAVLLDFNCSISFIVLPTAILISAGLTFLLPRTKGKHLE